MEDANFPYIHFNSFQEDQSFYISYHGHFLRNKWTSTIQLTKPKNKIQRVGLTLYIKNEPS